MMDKTGTGDVIAEIPVGSLGTVRLRDDGDNDSFTFIELVRPDDTPVLSASSSLEVREREGDRWLKEQFESGRESNPPTTYDVGNGICGQCGLTWPKRKLTDGVCPKCE